MFHRNYSVALLFLAAMGIGTGCVKRSILAFEDHPTYAVTSLELSESKSYYVYKTHEHRFYMCVDTGDKLVCKRACGGTTDLGCPSAVATGYGTSSNVR